jgi:hypothetical protein
MKSPQSIVNYLLVGVAALLFAACSTQMEPAKKAIDDISSSVQAASADADQYIPDQVAEVKRKLADLNASFDMKDYAAVLAGAPALLTEAKGLAAAAAAKRDEVMKALAAQWTELSASVPPLVTSVKTRVDALSKARRVPKGVDLAAAKSGLGDATVLWDKAQAAFQSNHVVDAVTAAKDAKAKAEAAAAALKIN